MKQLTFFLLAIIILLSACKSERQRRLDDAAEEMEAAAEKMAEAADNMAEQLSESLDDNADNMADAMDKLGEAMSGNPKVKAVNFRELKNILPEKAGGLPRQKSNGESNTALGINVSEAEAFYYNEGEDPELKIKVIDMGSMSGFMKMGSIGWAMSEFDRDTGTGFERTTKIDGHKAFEEYDTDRKRGEINIIIADRFLVEIRGRDIAFEDIKEAATDFDFGELIDLAEDAVIN
jgi:hypothetical protein